MVSDFARSLDFTRRHILGWCGGGAVVAAFPAFAAQPQPKAALNLRLTAGKLTLRDGMPGELGWRFVTSGPEFPRYPRGSELTVSLVNELSVPAVLNWYGLNGAPRAEPLVAQPAVLPGQTASLVLPLRSAGTCFYDARLVGDGQAKPLPSGGFVVEEVNPPVADRDEVLLIEDWRLSKDGGLLAPGTDDGSAEVLYTVNGKPGIDIAVRANARLRLRFINGCQRNAIAFKIDDHVARIIAIDGQPAEPFPARDGRLILAPGTRIDALIDAVRPPGSIIPILLHDGNTPRPVGRLVYDAEAPLRDTPLAVATSLASNDLPSRLDLAGALRAELSVGETAAGPNPNRDWSAPARLDAKAQPAFRVKRGRTVVLTLVNSSATPSVFRLHGHHFRLLDRLDDGWKPFWLDTLLIDAKQTSRIAFAAEFAGNWLMEAVALRWSSSRRARRFIVE